MRYYEVLVADTKYKSDSALTYSSEADLPLMSVVTIPLRSRLTTGFVVKQVAKPAFTAKPVKSVSSDLPLPAHCLELARWMAHYYAGSLGEALRQFAPNKAPIRQIKTVATAELGSDKVVQLEL